jgi:hypothetical protein
MIRASVAASNALLGRGHGKPVAQIEMDHHVDEFDGMTEEDLGEYNLEQMSKLRRPYFRPHQLLIKSNRKCTLQLLAAPSGVSDR